MVRTSYFGYYDRIHYKYYCYMSVEEYLTKIKGWDLTEREPLITVEVEENTKPIIDFLIGIANPPKKQRRTIYREYDGKRRCTKCNERKDIEKFYNKKVGQCNDCKKLYSDNRRKQKLQDKIDYYNEKRANGEIIDCVKCDTTGKETIGNTDVNGIRTEYVRNCRNCYGKGYVWVKEKKVYI